MRRTCLAGSICCHNLYRNVLEQDADYLSLLVPDLEDLGVLLRQLDWVNQEVCQPHQEVVVLMACLVESELKPPV